MIGRKWKTRAADAAFYNQRMEKWPMDQNRLYYATPYVKTFMCTVISCTKIKRNLGYDLKSDCFLSGRRRTAKWYRCFKWCKSFTCQRKGRGDHPRTGGSFGRRGSGRGSHWLEETLWQYAAAHRRTYFSGLVHKHFGYDNVGFHMGTDEVTVDLTVFSPRSS